MAVDITLDQRGLRKVLESRDGDVAKELTRKLIRIQGEARRRVNVREGRLRNSIQWDLKVGPGGVYGEVGSNLDYAEAVHNGTKAHEIRPKYKKVLRFKSGGAVVFARSVWHPGTRANPFLVDAANVVLRRF